MQWMPEQVISRVKSIILIPEYAGLEINFFVREPAGD